MKTENQIKKVVLANGNVVDIEDTFDYKGMQLHRYTVAHGITDGTFWLSDHSVNALTE